MSANLPASQRLRRALHLTADALADVLEEIAAGVSAPEGDTEAQRAVDPNDDTTRARALGIMRKKGWPLPKVRR